MRMDAQAAPIGGNRSSKASAAPAPDVLTPADRYQELFVAVQREGVFPDSKTFVDCAPLGEPAAILAAYRAAVHGPGFDLHRFVQAHFMPVRPAPREYESIPGRSLGAHIEALWPVLTRHPKAHPPHASLLQLPHSYVVPGGRFGELYYWDSYFTMLGLAGSGHTGLLEDMVENFAYLIDTYGHVPNGTRTYYLSRSQPPVFSLMVDLAERHCAIDATCFLPQLRQEHAYWMNGSEGLQRGAADRRVVRLDSGALLNRHWDDRDTPREESWLEDVTTVDGCSRAPAEVYRHLRAACESGWDFSSRWLREAPVSKAPHASAHVRAASARSLASICTTDIIPIDLNAFLFGLERRIATLAERTGDAGLAHDFSERAAARKAAVHDLCWDAEQGSFFDYDWRSRTRRSSLTAACTVPLFVGMADAAQAEALAATVERRLLAPGGLATTECESDQQWDRPNGWAPLQWMGIQGFADYGFHRLADTIAHGWLATVAAVYEREAKLVEKYALRHVEPAASEGGAGGEYPLQDGFGWTNGVTCALLARQAASAAKPSTGLGDGR
ncbi:MAG: alpha,alpha-trehalase TreF [Comamonadaceae bacterium]|nr:MAG: alpha,alpha-trehalase TreF [Comamonadaceae bacterium]